MHDLNSHRPHSAAAGKSRFWSGIPLASLRLASPPALCPACACTTRFSELAITAAINLSATSLGRARAGRDRAAGAVCLKHRSDPAQLCSAQRPVPSNRPCSCPQDGSPSLLRGGAGSRDHTHVHCTAPHRQTPPAGKEPARRNRDTPCEGGRLSWPAEWGSLWTRSIDVFARRLLPVALRRPARPGPALPCPALPCRTPTSIQLQL